MIIIFAMFLVSLLALTAVSAAENATDDIAIADDDICEELDVSTDEILTGNPTIADLNRTINNNTDSEITLDSDYTYTDSDSRFKNGIEITRFLTINGNGHTIDGGKKLRIFHVIDGNVIFKNITFINGYTDEYGYGGAIWANKDETYVEAINCTFNNNLAHYGGAIANVNAINCTFNSNYVTNYLTSRGGAAYGGTAVNCTFNSNNAYNGGAIYIPKDEEAVITNCIFIKNQGKGGGGALYLDQVSNRIISNCIFVNNIANSKSDDYGKGGAIYIYMGGNNNVMNCIFINNTSYKYAADIYWRSSNGAVNNSVFISSSNKTIDSNYYEVTANGNWFGNTATNYNVKPIVNNTIKMTSWLFLNATANPNPVAITRTADITFDLYRYDSATGDISKYDIGELKPIMNINSTNGNIDKDIAEAGEVIKYTADSIGTCTITAKIGNVKSTIEITVRNPSFNDLQELINNAEPGSTITLQYDYTYIDSDPTDGIIIGRDLIIDGNGHIINGTGNARIFKIIPRNVEFHNITFADGYTTESGAAIRVMDGGYCYAINCTFEDNEAERGGAMYGGAAINCSFIGNEATYGGAAFGSEAIGCSFIDNDAEEGGAIYGGTSINCTFNNNHATNGGAIYQGMAENCTFNNNHATQYGGAIYKGEVKNCIFNSNSARYGGAIYGGSATQSTFNSNHAQDLGGAIYEIGDDGKIDKCDFINNTADDDGGAIYVSKNEFEIFNCNFINNTAYDDGGAIYGFNHNCKIYNSNFINNTAYDDGGAIYTSKNDCEIFNCNFINNTAYDNGGVICGFEYNCKIYNINFINNTAGYDGGAILWGGVNGEFSDCNFINNTATNDGGAIQCEGDNSEISNCNFINNTAGYDGGAIQCEGDNSEISNCNFINNTATEYGGAIDCTGNHVQISSCTFANNSAANGAAFSSADGSDFVVSKCIFVNNKGVNGTMYYEETYDITINNNIFINNNGPDVYFAEGVYDYNADYNWFGNTADNYKNTPNTQNVTLDTWLFLNATANPDTMAVLSSTDIIFKLYAYNSTSEEISEYNNAQLIPVDMAITANKGDLNVNTAHLGDKIKFTAKGTDASVTATIENITYTIKLNVAKLDSNLSLESKEVAYGENIIIALDYKSYATGKVNITLKGKKHNMTFSNIDLKNLILLGNVLPDEYNISVIYSGDDYFNNATANATLKVNKLTTQITSEPVTTVYNSAKYLIITLKDSTGKTINGAELTVNLNGDKTYTTDKNGQVKINVATLVPKTYSAKITFAGDDIYAGSAATAKVVVKKANAKITAKKKTFKKSLKVKKYTITLKSGKNPIKKVQVTIKIGKKTYKAKTNNKGKATFKIKKLTKKGTYKATIKFKGNKYYNKATKTVKIKIK